jgi:hypothetical protein
LDQYQLRKLLVSAIVEKREDVERNMAERLHLVVERRGQPRKPLHGAFMTVEKQIVV